MKKQDLLVIPFLFIMGISFFSCNFGNKGNVSNYQNTPAVVSIDYTIGGGGVMLGTPYGYMAAPELSNLYDGDCIYLQQFSVDYDNQPSTQYVTATDIVEIGVNKSQVEVANDSVRIGDYTLLPTSVSGLSSVYYGGNFFIGATCSDNNPNYRLVYNLSDTLINNAIKVYLLAQSTSTAPSSSGVSSIHAFDMNYLPQTLWRDTTITISGTSQSLDLKYISVNLNYISSISDTGVPTYSQASQNPFLIFLFKNQ